MKKEKENNKASKARFKKLMKERRKFRKQKN